MRAELLDVYRDRCSDPLGAEHSNRAGVPSGLAFNGSPYFARALFEVTSGGGVLDRRGWTGEMDDARSGHWRLRWLLPATGISPDLRPRSWRFQGKDRPFWRD